MDENTSPQPTSKMVSDSTATNNSITENNKNVNSNSKKIDDERKSIKRSYEVDSTGEESEFEKDTTLFLWLATEYKRSQYCKN